MDGDGPAFGDAAGDDAYRGPVIGVEIAEFIALARAATVDDLELLDALPDELQSRPLRVDDGLRLLAAAREMPSPDPDWLCEHDLPHPAGALLSVVADHPDPAYVAPALAMIGERPFIDWNAPLLRVLASVPTREAAEAFCHVVRARAGDPHIGACKWEALYHRPHHESVFLPTLLALSTHPWEGRFVADLLRHWCEEGRIARADLDGHAGPILAAWRADRPAASPELAGTPQDPIDAQTALASDLLPLLDDPAVEPALREGLRRPHAALRLGALEGLLRRGNRVTAAELAPLAADLGTRADTLDLLHRFGLGDDAPEPWCRGVHAAAGAMAEALRLESDARRPLRLEPVAVVPAGPDRHGAPLVWFVFRWMATTRTDGTPGWVPAIVGPVREDVRVPPDGLGWPWYDGAPWERRTVAGHVRACRRAQGRLAQAFLDARPRDEDDGDSPGDDDRVG